MRPKGLVHFHLLRHVLGFSVALIVVYYDRIASDDQFYIYLHTGDQGFPTIVYDSALRQ